jgi:hypothetical protein
LATAALVAGDEKGNGESGYGQWLPRRGWRAFDGGDDGGDTKDTAARVTTGERGMMVATGHGLCVCFGRPQKIRKSCAWAGGTFFQMCCCVSFWFGFTFLRITIRYLRVQYSCGVLLVFWFWREIVFGVTYVLSLQYSCAVVSVFWLWREIVLKMRTPFEFLLP